METDEKLWDFSKREGVFALAGFTLSLISIIYFLLNMMGLNNSIIFGLDLDYFLRGLTLLLPFLYLMFILVIHFFLPLELKKSLPSLKEVFCDCWNYFVGVCITALLVIIGAIFSILGEI